MNTNIKEMNVNKLFATIIAGAVALCSVGWAQHGHDEDLVPGFDDQDYLVLIEPDEIIDPPYVLEVMWDEVVPGVFIADVGFVLNHDDEDPMVSRVGFLQTDVSAGLFGVVEGEVDPIFGLGTPGLLSLSAPDNGHVHVTFTAPDNSFRFLRFGLVNGVAFDDGRPLNDSLITYELQFVPEPATWLAVLAGVGFFATRRRAKP
ncbi:MAG: PEP-CTERM sorting domain-containing protein [Fimbriimonadia bacterium]